MTTEHPYHLAYGFFFTHTPATAIYTLSLHDALPISRRCGTAAPPRAARPVRSTGRRIDASRPDRKSTRLNSSHGYISYAVFCLKKKKKEMSQSFYHAHISYTHPTQRAHSRSAKPFVM